MMEWAKAHIDEKIKKECLTTEQKNSNLVSNPIDVIAFDGHAKIGI